MRLSLSIIVTGVTSLLGAIGGHPLLWIPYSGLAASLIFEPFRPWVLSERVGTSQVASMLLKLTISLIGTYAMLCLYACLVLGVYWLVR